MGTTTKIWPVTSQELRHCVAEPKHVERLFVRCGEEYAMIHDSIQLERLLDALAQQGPGLQKLVGPSDSCFLMSPDCVAALLDEAPGDPYRAILGFETICDNRIEIIDLARRAAAAGHGLAFCVYEDW
jgi:hypothetical protein